MTPPAISPTTNAKSPPSDKTVSKYTVSHALPTGAKEQSYLTEYPPKILEEFAKKGLSQDEATFCEIAPGTKAYKSVIAYLVRRLHIPAVAIDRSAEKCCAEDEDVNDTLGEWEDAEDSDEEEGTEEGDEGKLVMKKGNGKRRRKIGPAAKVKFCLALGIYTVKFKDNTVYLGHYSRGKPVMNVYQEVTETFRGLVLGMPGKSKATVETLREFLQKAADWYRRDTEPCVDEGKFSLHRYRVRKEDGWWVNDGVKRGRPLESIVLPKTLRDAIVEDVDTFLQKQTKDWYLQHGLPHRRSYLFYGPPGTGKSSMIRALAGRFQLNACFLAMANKDFNNELLGDALHDCPGNALLVLEDVDCLFEDRRATDGVALTFSGLLNALDGMMSSDGRITIMTTNYIDKLDSAMIRCGRVDRRFEFPQATKSQAEDLFKSFYPDAEKQLLEEFSEKVWNREEDEARSIATLQQLFIYCRLDSAKVVLSRIGEFFEAFFPHGPKKKNALYT